MTIDYIVDYVMNTPTNTNKKILIDLLESLDIEVENKKYSIEEIVNYVMNSSYNTNKAVLIDMIGSINKEGGGEDEWITIVNRIFDVNNEGIDPTLTYEDVKGLLELSEGDKIKATISHADEEEVLYGTVNTDGQSEPDPDADVWITRALSGDGTLNRVDFISLIYQGDCLLDVYAKTKIASMNFDGLPDQTVKVKIEYQKQ